MAATSLDLSQIKTDALVQASTFRTLIGIGAIEQRGDDVLLNGMAMRADDSGTPADIDLFGFGKVSNALDDGDAYTNVVMSLGYNLAANSARLDTSYPACGITIESKYRANNTAPFMFEHHLQGYHADGAAFRVQTGVIPHTASEANNGTSRLAFQYQTYVFSRFDGDVLLQINANTVNNASEFSYPGQAVHFYGINNYVFSKQRNAADTDYVPLPFINSSDIYVIPAIAKCTEQFEVVKAFTPGVYTFATLPSASSNTGAWVRISDRGQKPAYSDGTDWRFFSSDSVVS